MLAAESLDVPVVGRLVARGLDDELNGTAYAVVDGLDGRTIVVQTPRDADTLRKNPLGIYVNAIDWSKELGQ